MNRNTLVNVGLALLSLMAIALATEVALRFVLARGLNPFQPDPILGFRLKPDFEGVYPRVRVRTDELGRRVPLEQEAPASGRWLFLGDSVAFGFGVAAEDGFPWRLAGELGDPRDATVTAVPGYNLEQALGITEESLAVARPERIVYGLVVNDPSGAAQPATYADIDPHAASSESGGLLGRSMLVAFVQRRLNRITASFDPPPERAERLGSITDLEAELEPAELEAFDRQWAALEALQERLGVPVDVLICPYRQQVEDPAVGDAFQRFAHTRCDAGPLTCLDPLDVFRARAAEGLFNGASSYHYNERGHALMADWLLAQVDW